MISCNEMRTEGTWTPFVGMSPLLLRTDPKIVSALKPCRLLIVSCGMSLMPMTYLMSYVLCLMSYVLYLINFSYKLFINFIRPWSCDDVGLVLDPVLYLINFYKLLSRAGSCDVGLMLGPVVQAYDSVTLAG